MCAAGVVAGFTMSVEAGLVTRGAVLEDDGASASTIVACTGVCVLAFGDSEVP